jgi:hypothetical protein
MERRTGISGRAIALLTSPTVLEIDPDTGNNAVHDLAVGRGGLLYVADAQQALRETPPGATPNV